jgi:hypothetical protein
MSWWQPGGFKNAQISFCIAQGYHQVWLFLTWLPMSPSSRLQYHLLQTYALFWSWLLTLSCHDLYLFRAPMPFRKSWHFFHQYRKPWDVWKWFWSFWSPENLAPRFKKILEIDFNVLDIELCFLVNWWILCRASIHEYIYKILCYWCLWNKHLSIQFGLEILLFTSLQAFIPWSCI